MHRKFLLLALEEAWKGRGCCAPNPSVGAVLVLNDKVIASAYHHGVGQLHAEALLLQNIEPNLNLKDATLYITLEPCNHWGKTPPCTDIIIKSGIKHVVFGYLDPNPLVKQNNSSNLLKAAGIRVEHVQEPEIDAFYKSYTYWIQHKLPLVIAKLAVSLDGKITPLANTRYQLTGLECEKFTHFNRLHADTILTTAKTIKIDNPQLNVRYFPDNCGRIVAILDKNSRLSGQEQVFNAAKYVHIYHTETLPEVLADLGARGMHDVWVEAGPTLFNHLHELGLVHKTYLYIAPVVLGNDAINAFIGNDFMKNAHKISWQSMGNDNICCIDWLG